MKINYQREEAIRTIREKITSKYLALCNQGYQLKAKDYRIIEEAVEQSISCVDFENQYGRQNAMAV
jgi:hypothetical protein